MATEQHSTQPVVDSVMSSYEDLGLTCGHVEAWAGVLRHMASSPTEITEWEMRVVADALHLVRNMLDEDRDHFLRMTGLRPQR